MGCYNSKDQLKIMKQKKDLQREKYLNKGNSAGKLTSDQLEKMRTKCDNENLNQENDKNEFLNDLQDQKNLYQSKQVIGESNQNIDKRPSIENKCSQQNQEENNQVSISKQKLQDIIEQEGFQEKVDHINKIYSFLLQSQDEGFDHCSFDDPDLTDFLSHLQTKLSSPQDQLQAVKNNIQIRRDTRGETIIDIPSETPEKLQSNLQGLINAVLSSDYRLITSPTQASIQNRHFQLDKLLQNTYSAKNILTLGTVDACSNSPSSIIDRTDQNRYQNFAQKYSQTQQCISPPKMSSNALQHPFSFTNIQTPKKNINNSIQQQQLQTISEEKKGVEGFEDHFDHEEELKTNKYRNSQQKLKKEESIRQKNETKLTSNRQNNENHYSKNKSSKNMSQLDAIASTNTTITKNKNLTIIEKNYRVSQTDIKKQMSPHSVYQIHSNNNGQQADHQAQISLYRHSINFNDISLQEIEEDFKDRNVQKPQIQVSPLALLCQEQQK